MSDKKLRTAMIVTMDNAGYKAGSAQLKSEWESIKRTLTSTQGILAGVGLGIGIGKLVTDSAKLDKHLIRIGQTAGATKIEVAGLRNELFNMAEKTGQSVEDLVAGFDSLVASGQTFQQATATIRGINAAMAVTGANAGTLAKGLTTAATAFNFDLSVPDAALKILDQMTVAGRLGNAELESLSGIFARVGVNAKSAGMSFEATLSFIETLSMIEKEPERLATIADSTLRIFTNAQYMKRIQNKTGIQFFDKAGARRDASDVFDDIRKKYSSLKNEQEKASFIGTVFKGADLDTVRGIRMLMQGDMLTKGREFSAKIKDAGGTIKRDLNDATNNMVDQGNRFKTVMRDAGDQFAKPVNKAMADGVQYLLDKNKMSGGTMIGAAATAGLMAWMAGPLIKNGIGRMLTGGARTAAGVAEGKALEAAAGITPVFVTNWPGGGVPGGAGGAGGAAGGAAAGGSIATKAAGMGLSLTALAVPLTAVVGMAVAAKIGQEQYFKNRYGMSMDEMKNGSRLATPAEIAKSQVSVNVYVDGKKVEPKKTDVSNRGSFELQPGGPAFSFPNFVNPGRP